MATTGHQRAKARRAKSEGIGMTSRHFVVTPDSALHVLTGHVAAYKPGEIRHDGYRLDRRRADIQR